MGRIAQAGIGKRDEYPRSIRIARLRRGRKCDDHEKQQQAARFHFSSSPLTG
jgi:hypothetical protein